MKKHFSAIILFILFLGLILSAQTAFAYTTIVQDYPELPACEGGALCRPGQESPLFGIFGIPEFIKYIFLFALGIVGIVGLTALIMAAFSYVTSVGNPQKAADAKDAIVAALLGLLLLLGSVILLRLINPDFLSLKVSANNIAVAINPPSNPAACHYTSATWAPTQTNAGDGVVLTLHRTGCTLAEVANHRPMLTLNQEVIGGSDLNCKRITDNALYSYDAQSYRTQLTFNEKCYDLVAFLGIGNCKNPVYDGPIICNMKKGDAERFYGEGYIEIPGQPRQYFSRVYITVVDGQ